MTKFTHAFCALAFTAIPFSAGAQYAWQEGAESEKLNLGHDIHYRVETQSSFSHGKTPLWLNANRHGLSSLDRSNGYLRGSLIRPLRTDSARRWGVGYGVDVAVPVHYTSKVVVQQAFVEGRWLHGVLTVGSKEYPMELKNQQLSSGSQALGINARPVPQARLALPEYWTLPIFGRWFHLKGHIAYGMMTDDNWQHDFTHRQSKYADNMRYHSKAGYLKIGSEERFCPWSLELGLEMAAEFGGTSHNLVEGKMVTTKANGGLKGMWHAFLPGGQDASDGQYGNIEGNQLGSWVARINYDTDSWALRLYADHFFEDHSALLHLDYDGYGSGEEYNVKKDRRFYLYKLKDFMLGTELNIKYGRWLRNMVFEYIHTKFQSGPYNHDHTKNIPDHVAGMDNYYNHANYPGWQHWGQVMGNPLYRSPIYNTNEQIGVEDNRFMAFHLGFDGRPADRIAYRVLATYQEGWGTYAIPYTQKHHNVSFLLEAAYHFKHNWNVKGAYAMDFGHILGSNAGFQLTVSKSGILKF